MKNWKTTKSQTKRESKELKAVGISLNEDYNIPELSISGKGELAKEIKRIALRYGIPVKKHKDLTEKLAELEEGENIPFDCYYDIAKIISEL